MKLNFLSFSNNKSSLHPVTSFGDINAADTLNISKQNVSLLRHKSSNYIARNNSFICLKCTKSESVFNEDDITSSNLNKESDNSMELNLLSNNNVDSQVKSSIEDLSDIKCTAEYEEIEVYDNFIFNNEDISDTYILPSVSNETLTNSFSEELNMPNYSEDNIEPLSSNDNSLYSYRKNVNIEKLSSYIIATDLSPVTAYSTYSLNYKLSILSLIILIIQYPISKALMKKFGNISNLSNIRWFILFILNAQYLTSFEINACTNFRLPINSFRYFNFMKCIFIPLLMTYDSGLYEYISLAIPTAVLYSLFMLYNGNPDFETLVLMHGIYAIKLLTFSKGSEISKMNNKIYPCIVFILFIITESCLWSHGTFSSLFGFNYHPILQMLFPLSKGLFVFKKYFVKMSMIGPEINISSTNLLNYTNYLNDIVKKQIKIEVIRDNLININLRNLLPVSNNCFQSFWKLLNCIMFMFNFVIIPKRNGFNNKSMLLALTLMCIIKCMPCRYKGHQAYVNTFILSLLITVFIKV